MVRRSRAAGVLLLLLGFVLGRGALAAGCEPPDPEPPVPYGWLPTCVLVRADAPQAESVIPNQAAALFQEPRFAEAGPFDEMELHPLGFSPEGRFAWLSLGGGGDDRFGWGLFIVDLRTDEVLERYFGPPGSQQRHVWDLASVIRAHRRELQRLLDRHGIRVEALPVVDAPFQRAQRSYALRVQAEGGDYAVWMESAELGQKRLGPLETWSPCALCGSPRFRVIFSPFEDRAAVVVAHRAWRSHSTIPGVKNAVFGVHLTTGFTEGD